MKKLITIFSLSIAASPLALADNGLGLSDSFNAVIFGNASTNGGHSDGGVAVEGNWTGSGYDVAQKSGLGNDGSTSGLGLLVDGTLNYTSGGSLNNGSGLVGGSFKTQNSYNVNSGKNVLVGGSVTTATNNGNHIKGNQGTIADPSFFTSQDASLTALSKTLEGESANATINKSDPNNWTANVGSTGTYVFDINGADLGHYATLQFNGDTNDNDTIIINVNGNVNNFDVSLNGSHDKVLWNFYNATTVNVNNRQLEGTVLALDATVNQSINIEGGLYAAGWNNSGSVELHYTSSDQFDGKLPAVAPVPEPCTIGLSLAGIGLVLRRRRNANRA